MEKKIKNYLITFALESKAQYLGVIFPLFSQIYGGDLFLLKVKWPEENEILMLILLFSTSSVALDQPLVWGFAFIWGRESHASWSGK